MHINTHLSQTQTINYNAITTPLFSVGNICWVQCDKFDVHDTTLDQSSREFTI